MAKYSDWLNEQPRVPGKKTQHFDLWATVTVIIIVVAVALWVTL